MGEIIELTKIDYVSVFIAVFAILFGVKVVVTLFEWIVTKLGLETKWMRQKREEHELLIQTSQGLLKLQEQHRTDDQKSDEHDLQIEKSMSEFMREVHELICQIQLEVKQFSENRVHDREQSREIQKDLNDSIKRIMDRNEAKDEQLSNLMDAQREVLADKINEKYKYYLSINGIPEDEVDEFVSLHKAYKGIGGNHTGDAKYDYVMNHMQVLPVKTKLIFDQKEKENEK